jgi:gliding motility-associated-like protein
MVFTKKTPIIFFLFWTAFLLLPVFSFAQLTITQVSAATTLAQTIAGSGVTVSNASINCGGNAAGTFIYSGSNLGLTGGIILTTGDANNAANPGNYLCNVNNGNNFNDPDLTAIVSSANLDVCILEFDFVPTCNALNMTYVFGSEEYPQGVGHFNDAFGIFLSGPNPAGGNYTSQNIATLPSGQAVSINNVNAATNPAYFHNNYSSPNNDVAYNGYTIPVTSSTPVVPCSTYHTKIAIADGGNALYDSGVLISGNGVSCQNPATITASATPTGGCQNTGSATTSVTNYTGTVTYHWVPGGQTTASISNLGAGTYTCTVSLHQACGTITQTVNATVSSTGNNIVLTSAQTNLTCNGTSNGSATVTAVGGTAPYSCIWTTTPAQSGMSINNLSAGTFSGTVTDNAGCQSTIQIHITAPPAMQLNFSTTSATCTGSTGTASVNVTANGTAPYTYSWNTNPVQTTQAISNIAHGTYTVTVTGANSCSVTGVANVGTQNPSWTLSATTQSNIACFGGNNGIVTAAINNPGASTFSYSWNTNPPQTATSVSNLPMGNYVCTITDNNGCVISASTNVSQPALLVASLTSAPTICTGTVGSVNAYAVGGTAPYLYLWSNAQNTNSIQGLSPGQYSVTITDAHNCTASSMTSVGAINPTLQIIGTSASSSICGGPTGAITTSITNGAAPYSFAWATGQTTQNLSHLSPGIYAVTVTDNNGCVGNTSVPVNVVNTFPAQISSAPDYCNKNVGSATVIPFGNPPYHYVWNTSTPQTDSTANNLSAGNYTVIVTDAYNCKDSLSVTVVNYNDIFAPSFAVQPSDALFSEDPITINASTNGGWNFDNGTLSDGTIIPTLNYTHIFAQQGNYFATYYFTSTHGCKDSVTYQIKIKDEMTLYIPNSFTPNHNDVNDEFKAEGTLIQTFEMYIYDRWDNLIIKLEDITQGWNGKYKGQDVPAGIYVYKGTATNAMGEETDFNGQINLLR